jgi:hypothetical protein
LNAIFYAFSFVISRISGFSPLARKSQFDCSFIIIVQPLGLISVACQKEKGSIKKKKKGKTRMISRDFELSLDHQQLLYHFS